VRYQIRWLHGLAVHAAALLEMHEVRRGIDARAVAGLQGDGFEQRAGRALSVGARDGDHGAVEAQVQPLRHGTHALQAQFYGFGVQLLAMT